MTFNNSHCDTVLPVLTCTVSPIITVYYYCYSVYCILCKRRSQAGHGGGCVLLFFVVFFSEVLCALTLFSCSSLLGLILLITFNQTFVFTCDQNEWLGDKKMSDVHLKLKPIYYSSKYWRMKWCEMSCKMLKSIRITHKTT